MANTCAICGASINIFQSQKLSDGNYLCRKNCCKKAMKNFDLVSATLPQFQMHAAQVERGTMLWEKIFVPRRKNKNMKSNFYPFYVDLDTGLMALLETRYKVLWFGKSEHACVYRIADLVGYGMETETKVVDGKKQTEYFVHFSFRNTQGMSDFRVKYNREIECTTLAKFFDNLFGIQKTLGNAMNNWSRQKDAVKNIASAVGAAARGTDDAEEKTYAAMDSLDASVYGDRTEWIAKADAALAPYRD